jgi:hypothetical protein
VTIPPALDDHGCVTPPRNTSQYSFVGVPCPGRPLLAGLVTFFCIGVLGREHGQLRGLSSNLRICDVRHGLGPENEGAK